MAGKGKPGPPKGVRIGGKPKGYKAPHTLEKLEMQRIFRERISAKFEPLADALVDKALGVQHMMARGKDGKWIEVKEPEMMQAALNMGEGFYRIYATAPDPNALRDVFDRVMGRAAQEVDITVKSEPRAMTDEELIAEARKLLGESDGALVH